MYHGSQNLLIAKIESISRFIQHLNYCFIGTDGAVYDVPVVQLSNPIANFPNTNSAAVCLPCLALEVFPPEQPGTTAGQSIAYVAGWGATYEGQGQPANLK